MGRSTNYRSTDGEEKIKKKYHELLRHWPIEKQEHTIQTRFGSTHVIVSGNAENPPLVLLHGACENSLMWLKQIKRYCHSYRVYAIDIIGEANISDAQRPQLASNHYVEWLEEILDQFSIKQVALIGNCLGAWISLRFAATFPDRIERLILLSPSGIIGMRWSLRCKFLLLTLISGTFGRRWILRRLLKRNLDVNQAELNELIVRYFKPRTWSLPNVFKKPFPPLYCPVLLMLGGSNRFYSADKIVLMIAKRIPQLELIYRPKEGHFLDDYTREVDRFLITEFAPD